MSHAPVMLLFVPVLATLAGGFLTLWAARLRTILVAVGAGILLGAAFLDLLPEALQLGAQAGVKNAWVLGWTLVFFLLFSTLEMCVDGWHDRRCASATHRRASGRLGGGLLIFHSFRDGMAIGAALTASHTAGYAVALGIAAHDFGDGMNTVLLTTGGKRPTAEDYWFLLADAAAPFLGGMLTIWWMVSSWGAAVLLALAAGFFLQMATSDFLPEIRRGRGPILMAGVAGGAAFIWLATWVLG